MAQRYAFKDCVDVKLYPAGTNPDIAVAPEGTIVIDYANSSQLTLEMESEAARIKGNDAILFSTGRTGEFTISAEVIELEFLAMLLGGEINDDGEIEINGDAPSQSYVLVGTFKGKKHSDNKDQIFKIVLYNIVPQPSVDMTLDATSIGSFDLTFKVLQNNNEQIAKIEVAK
jgi:hypothetical protein